ncbi:MULTISPECIES: hypothetical protein [unclassified Caballeronia]|uniref:hypothetical protein n=1 Tax=unclassified Caballeronia TaxID=2646786 RepID=UPI0020286DEE|nr:MULTISPECIES: hypothetical protein [unclassified Caballeronia]
MSKDTKKSVIGLSGAGLRPDNLIRKGRTLDVSSRQRVVTLKALARKTTFTRRAREGFGGELTGLFGTAPKFAGAGVSAAGRSPVCRCG